MLSLSQIEHVQSVLDVAKDVTFTIADIVADGGRIMTEEECTELNDEFLTFVAQYLTKASGVVKS